MAASTQAFQKIAIHVGDLPEDALLLQSFQVNEQLGRMFQIEAVMAAEQASVPFKSVIGKNATVRINLVDGAVRYWNGFVSHFSRQGSAGRLPLYRATIVPWLWFLNRTADFRAYQEMKVPEIVKDVFKDGGFTDVKDDTLGHDYGPWEYCIQYRETDFNFVSRLMEQEGMYYFFLHENGQHHLVLGDSISAHKPFSPACHEIAYRHSFGGGDEDSEFVFTWSVDQRLQPTSYDVTDYNFKKPKQMMTGHADNPDPHDTPPYEVFDYPGEFDESSDGDHYAKIRMQEFVAQQETVQAQTNARWIAAGSLVALKEYPDADQNREYLVTSMTLGASAGDFHSAAGGGGKAAFSCQFTAIPSNVPYRAPRVTPKPILQGPQTARVVGPAGEEIHTDKYGRIKVQFFWDRYGKKDDKSSMWMRVAQAWAGKRWGSVFLPRIGMEVLVQFLEGDPDSPVVVGALYNDDYMPPYTLPDQKNLSGVKSNSTKGGKGFNEIRLDDTKGEEQVFVHAQKNHDTNVKNDLFETIGNDRHLIVYHDQFEEVKRDRHEVVKRDHVETIKRDRYVKVEGKEGLYVVKDHSLQVDGEVIEKFDKNHSEETTKDIYLHSTTGKIVIEAATNITLNVGDSFIAIDNTGIKIGTKGQIKLEADMQIGITGKMGVKTESQLNVETKGLMVKQEAQTMLDLKGLMVQLQGSAMAKVAGAITMIG